MHVPDENPHRCGARAVASGADCPDKINDLDPRRVVRDVYRLGRRIDVRGSDTFQSPQHRFDLWRAMPAAHAADPQLDFGTLPMNDARSRGTTRCSDIVHMVLRGSHACAASAHGIVIRAAEQCGSSLLTRFHKPNSSARGESIVPHRDP